MRCLNEYLACKANKEDNCKGRFWEGRFKSQPLLDESAVLTAMTYVDLNPIRANMSKTLEKSDYTSIQQRINQLKNQSKPVIPLMKLSPSQHQAHKNSFAFSTQDYLQLTDWAGRAIRDSKRGYIAKLIYSVIMRSMTYSKDFRQKVIAYKEGLKMKVEEGAKSVRSGQ